ncbi:MAG: flagellar M-ring protein FliF, partial [Treponema sp.]|nr:flagellar M-ring protein FliF [Treponema sp.]
MNDWLKKLTEQVRAMWAKWTIAQKLILTGIVLAAVIAVVVLLRVSAAPTMVKILGSPIRSDDEMQLITNKLDAQGIAYTV